MIGAYQHATAPGKSTRNEAESDAPVPGKMTRVESSATAPDDSPFSANAMAHAGDEHAGAYGENPQWEDISDEPASHDDETGARSSDLDPLESATAQSEPHQPNAALTAREVEAKSKPQAPGAQAEGTAARRRTPLRIVSLNVFEARIQRSELQYLARSKADVIFLQEASAANAKYLADQLHMHAAAYQAADCAIVSRFPITNVERHRFDGYSTKQRAANARRARRAFRRTHPHGSKRQELSWAHEARKPRGYIAATIVVNGEAIDLIDVHLSLRDTVSNTRELEELRRQFGRREGQGRKVVAGGDFNTNFVLAKPGHRDRHGVRTKTDTLGECSRRYGGDAGNIRSAANRKAVRKLMGQRAYWWNAAKRRVTGPKGKQIDPKRLLAMLRKPGAPKPGSARWKKWMAMVDGFTHIEMAKRFDNLIASRGSSFKRSSIDHVRGTDHRAIKTEVVL